MLLYEENKRYYAFSGYLKQKYSGKVAKISLDAGFTCPNIDGTKGVGGCTYCSGRGSGDFAGDPRLSIREQFFAVAKRMQEKWASLRYIPYFQAFTNTYAPVPVLRRLYEEALSLPDVVGLAIATRADCISDEAADLLQELSRRTDLVVELGLQSVFDETGERIHRCHTFADFLAGFAKLSQRNIPVCVHIINGLPGETPAMMLHTANTIARLPLHSVKIHLLHVLRGTKMAEEYERGEFSLLSREDYVQIVCNQLEVLSPRTVIQRLTGDGKAEDLIGPMWSLKKLVVMNEIDKELRRRNSWQGKFYTP